MQWRLKDVIMGCEIDTFSPLKYAVFFFENVRHVQPSLINFYFYIILINKYANEAEFKSESLVICNSWFFVWESRKRISVSIRNVTKVLVVCFSFCCDHVDGNALFLPPDGAKVSQTSQWRPRSAQISVLLKASAQNLLPVLLYSCVKHF